MSTMSTRPLFSAFPVSPSRRRQRLPWICLCLANPHGNFETIMEDVARSSIQARLSNGWPTKTERGSELGRVDTSSWTLPVPVWWSSRLVKASRAPSRPVQVQRRCWIPSGVRCPLFPSVVGIVIATRWPMVSMEGTEAATAITADDGPWPLSWWFPLHDTDDWRYPPPSMPPFYTNNFYCNTRTGANCHAFPPALDPFVNNIVTAWRKRWWCKLLWLLGSGPKGSTATPTSWHFREFLGLRVLTQPQRLTQRVHRRILWFATVSEDRHCWRPPLSFWSLDISQERWCANCSSLSSSWSSEPADVTEWQLDIFVRIASRFAMLKAAHDGICRSADLRLEDKYGVHDAHLLTAAVACKMRG